MVSLFKFIILVLIFPFTVMGTVNIWLSAGYDAADLESRQFFSMMTGFGALYAVAILDYTNITTGVVLSFIGGF